MLIFLKRSVHHVHLQDGMGVPDPARHGAHVLAIKPPMAIGGQPWHSIQAGTATVQLMDGRWHDDPGCKFRAPNPFGSQDSNRKVA